MASVGYIFKEFVGKRGLAIKRKLFKLARIKVAINIKGVNGRNLKRRLIKYKLKSSLLLINSFISISNHSIELSL